MARARHRRPKIDRPALRARRARRDSKAAIFRAAAREFADRGYDAAGVDQIAAKARVNKAMLYYHYGNKLGLYVEILRDMFRAVGVQARAIADSSASPASKLDGWIETIAREAAARPWFPPIMLRELAGGGAHLDAETIGMMHGVYAAVRDIIVQGQERGTFRDADPLLTHLTIMPPILLFFARQQVVARQRVGSELGAPRELEDFVAHMQGCTRRMLRKDR